MCRREGESYLMRNHLGGSAIMFSHTHKISDSMIVWVGGPLGFGDDGSVGGLQVF